MDRGSNAQVCDGDVCCYGWIFLDDSGIYTAFPVPYSLIWDKNGREKSRISPGKSGCFPVFPGELRMDG